MAFNIWERWPWTSFQNLNLDWLMKAVKEAVTKAEEASAKASSVEAVVGTYTDQINAATLTANQAMNIARNADDVLFIYSDSENKAVDYKQYTEGVTAYITAPDIFSAVTADHKVPVFMDSNMYFYDMAGYETNPEQPLMVTRVKFVKDGVNRQDIVWIDRNGSITYTTAYRGGGTFVVNITHSQATGSITSDKTYNEISSAYNSGMTVQCHVVDEVRNQEYYVYDCFFTENSETGDYFGWVSPYDYSNNRFYRAFVREDNFVGISVLPISGGGSGMFVIPVTSSTSGGVTTYSTTATFAEIMAHMPNLIVQYDNLYYSLSYSTTSDPNSWYRFIFTAQEPLGSGELDTEWLFVECGQNAVTVTAASLDIKGLPATTSASAGDILKLDANKNVVWGDGNKPRVLIASDSPAIPTLSPNTLYVFTGDAAALSITLTAPTNNNVENEYHFIFNSGSTPTTLTLPNTIRQPDGFTVEANHVYEVSILENNMTAQGWAVTP